MVVLIRYGEIGLKGRNRPQFERQLLRRIRFGLGSLPARLRREHGRLFVESEASWPEIAERLRRVFGIVAFSPVRVVPLKLADIEQAALAELHAVVQERGTDPGQGRPLTFKVEARRANKRFPLTSLELNQVLGRALLEAPPPGIELRVDVHAPEIVVHVEIRDEAAYVYARSERGLGGLPVGSSGRALALLSGGIDSPVAVWLT
ncbi:MAG TPA: THUMP domain-containing protein, partial [Bacillota bacterium]